MTGRRDLMLFVSVDNETCEELCKGPFPVKLRLCIIVTDATMPYPFRDITVILILRLQIYSKYPTCD